MDERTRREIEKAAWRVLRDTGSDSPPVDVVRLVKHLEMYREFYDLSDPTFLDRVKHALVVGTRRLASRSSHRAA